MTRPLSCGAAPRFATALLFAALALAETALAAPPRAHLDLEVELDPAARRFHARAEIAATGEFAFTLHRSLAVLKTSANGEAVPARIVESSEHLRRWHIVSPPGATVRIEYGGTLPALDRTLDHRGVLAARGPMASAEGSFLPSGSGWYPEPAARFSYRVRIVLPPGQRGLVAGRLASESISGAGGRNQAVFEFGQPAEGIDFMAGPYSVRERLIERAGRAPLRLRTYFFADLEPLADGYLEDSARYIALYSHEIGDYPFDAFSVVASPLPTGFGMPTLTYIGRDVLKLPFIRATSLGHEVLHNWWGNGVYVDYASGNWSEGLTTFMADYFYKERESAAAAREMRLAWLRDFASVPENAHQPLSAFRARTHGAEAIVGYSKAAIVFLMLRDEIGETAFRAGVRAFWKAQQFKSASWNDLRRAFEETSGRALGSFFEQWLQRSVGPALKIVDARPEDGKTIAVAIEQSAPPYALSVPIDIVAQNRAETHRVPVDRDRTVVTIAPGFAADGVRLDPDFRLWRKLDPQTLPPILRQWIVARAPHLAVVSRSADLERAAQAVSERLFERPATRIGSVDGEGEPLLIVGLADDVDRALATSRLPPRPAAVALRGSVQVWTIAGRHPPQAPIAVASARDAGSLLAIARSLPHYGTQSWLVYDGARVVERGVWPVEVPVVPVVRR